MREYLVMFHKVVPDAAGYDRRILQRRTVVSARSEVSAAYAAKAMFSEAAGIADWRMRADTCEVVELSASWRDKAPLAPPAAASARWPAPRMAADFAASA